MDYGLLGTTSEINGGCTAVLSRRHGFRTIRSENCRQISNPRPSSSLLLNQGRKRETRRCGGGEREVERERRRGWKEGREGGRGGGDGKKARREGERERRTEGG